MAMMMRFLISISSEYAGIFAHQLSAGLQAYLAYAAVPVGGEEEVHQAACIAPIETRCRSLSALRARFITAVS